MMSTMNLQEVSRILEIPVNDIRRIVRSHADFRSHRAGGGNIHRFTETDIELLRNLLVPEPDKTSPTSDHEMEMKSMPEKINPTPAESSVTESFRNDVVRAVYAGGRRQEAALDALRGQIRQEAKQMTDDQHLALGTILAQMKAEFTEMKVKLNRHGRMIEDVQVGQHSLLNRLKKSDNLVSVKTMQTTPQATPPLSWFEKLIFSFFQPWKLRGRI